MPYKIKDKIKFLSEASKILSSSLDYNSTLSVIAKLAVSQFADYCMIDILDAKGKLLRVTTQIDDKSLHKLAQKMFDFPSDPKNKQAVYEVAKTGNSILVETISEEWLKGASRNPEERKLIKKLGLHSFMFTPLKSRQTIIGVLTLVSNNPKFSYTKSDLLLAEELSSRAGIAVDKARLYMEAQDAVRMRDEFLSIASHELKTPLTSILLNLQLALMKIHSATNQKTVPKDVVKLIETNISQSRRMSRLINDLLNISVISSGRLEIEKEECDLSSLIADILPRFSKSLKRRKTKIVFKKKPGIIGNWDSLRIEQVMSNLISNALKYGNNKPVSISLSKLGNIAKVEIHDEGIGIAKQDQGFIFERFKRAVASKEYKGLGVGLYISRQIVEAHGGKLKVVSQYKKGSTFTVDLPIK